VDPYAVLGVDLSASEAEIARAFRRLALQHHPDRNGGSSHSAERFREVKAAYEALCDEGRGREARRPAESDGRHARHVDPEPVARVRARIAKLNETLDAAIAAPTRDAVAAVIDAARWARLDVDTALALKGHVADLRDARWTSLRFSTAPAALATFAAFVDAPTQVLNLVEMRNLRARLEGLLAVARGYHATL